VFHSCLWQPICEGVGVRGWGGLGWGGVGWGGGGWGGVGVGWGVGWGSFLCRGEWVAQCLAGGASNKLFVYTLVGQ
jgi:hypothetical protein